MRVGLRPIVRVENGGYFPADSDRDGDAHVAGCRAQEPELPRRVVAQPIGALATSARGTCLDHASEVAGRVSSDTVSLPRLRR